MRRVRSRADVLHVPALGRCGQPAEAGRGVIDSLLFWQLLAGTGALIALVAVALMWRWILAAERAERDAYAARHEAEAWQQAYEQAIGEPESAWARYSEWRKETQPR